MPENDGGDKGEDKQESKKERIDRELGELLQELRVAIPGVQVMLAFLLTVPFSQGFPQMTSGQRGVYFAATMATAVASVMFITPSVYHRLRWRAYDKERMLLTANRTSIAGSVFLALAIALVVFLVADVLFGIPGAGISAGVVASLLAWFWFALPLLRGRNDRR
jgi:hypothetical protein